MAFYGYNDREESENKKRKKKGCLPNIEECAVLDFELYRG